MTMVDRLLPTDVLIELLIRLPVKSILKFRCVSKTWCDLIGSPVFVSSHQKREGKQRVLLVKRYSPLQKGDDEVLSFINLSIPISDDLDTTSYRHLHILTHSLPPQNGDGETFSFHDPDFPEVLVSPNLPIPVLNDLNIPWHGHKRIPIHGPCNGLVCITFDKSVFLCNPALREFKLLPPLRFPVDYSSLSLQYGFGFDSITGEYKVMQISDVSHATHQGSGSDLSLVLGGNKIRFDLYNSGSNSWKQIDAKVPDISYVPSYELFYNGAIHWFAIIAPYNIPCILCFDVSTETFRQLDFHGNFCPYERDLRLMELDDNLAVVRYSPWTAEPRKTEIWVMKEYGVKESWTKQFVIGPYCVICPFLFLKNEELLVESDNGQLATCALQEHHFKGFQFYGDHRSMSAVFYEESLISLNETIASNR